MFTLSRANSHAKLQQMPRRMPSASQTLQIYKFSIENKVMDDTKTPELAKSAKGPGNIWTVCGIC